MELDEFFLGIFSFVVVLLLLFTFDMSKRVQKIEKLINNDNDCITINDIEYCINE